MKDVSTVIGAITGIALIIIGSFALLNKAEPSIVEVTSIHGEWNYHANAFVVSLSIFNHGGSGTVTVWVEVEQQNTWKKAKRVSIDSKEPMDLTFVFPEPSRYQEIEYRAWVS